MSGGTTSGTPSIPGSSESEPIFVVSDRTTLDLTATSHSSETEPDTTVSERGKSVTPAASVETETQTEISERTIYVTPEISSDSETEADITSQKTTSVTSNIPSRTEADSTLPETITTETRRTSVTDSYVTETERSTAYSSTIQSSSETYPDFTQSTTTISVISYSPGNSKSEPNFVVTDRTTPDSTTLSHSTETGSDSPVSRRNTSVTPFTSVETETQPELSERTIYVTPELFSDLETKANITSLKTTSVTSNISSRTEADSTLLETILTETLRTSTTQSYVTETEKSTAETPATSQISEKEVDSNVSKSNVPSTEAIPTTSESDLIVTDRTTLNTNDTSQSSETEPDTTVSEQRISVTPSFSVETETKPEVSERTIFVTPEISSDPGTDITSQKTKSVTSNIPNRTEADSTVRETITAENLRSLATESYVIETERITANTPTTKSSSESEPNFTPSERTPSVTASIPGSSEPETDFVVSDRTTSDPTATSHSSETEPDTAVSERGTSVTPSASVETETQPEVSERTIFVTSEISSSSKTETGITYETTTSATSNIPDRSEFDSTIPEKITAETLSNSATESDAAVTVTSTDITSAILSTSETEPDFTQSVITAISGSSESGHDFIVSEIVTPKSPSTSSSPEIESYSTVSDWSTSITPVSYGGSETQPESSTSGKITYVTPPVSNVVLETTQSENSSVNTLEPVSSDDPGYRTADLTSTYSINTSVNTILIDNTTNMKDSTTDSTSYEITDVPVSSSSTTPFIWTTSSTQKISEIVSSSDSTENSTNVSDPLKPTLTSVAGENTYYGTSSEFDAKIISPVTLTSETNKLTSPHDVEEMNSTLTTELITQSTDFYSFPTESPTGNKICVNPNGFYPNPNDCRTFYQCSKGVPKLSFCTENDHFNPVMKICEDPCLAMCDSNADCTKSTSDFTDATGEISTSVTTDTITDTDKPLSTENSTPVHTKPERPLTSDSTNHETDPTGTSEFSHIVYISTPNQTSSSESEQTTGKTSEIYGSTTSPDIPTIISTTEQVTSEPYSKTDDSSRDYIITEIITHSFTPDDDNLVSTTKITSDINNLSSSASLLDSTSKSYTSEAPITETPVHDTSRSDYTTMHDSSITDSTTGIIYTSETANIPNTSTSQSSTVQLATKSTTEVETHSESDESSLDVSPSSYSTDTYTNLPTSTSILTTDSSCVDPENCFTTSVPDPSTKVPLALCSRNDFLPGNKCNEFINCTESIQVMKKCPTGLYFNPTKRVCDWPHSSGCGEYTKPLYRPDDSFDCPCKSCLVPSSENCEFYYLCLGYAAYRLKCSGNLLFDSHLNTCTYAFQVDCTVSTSTTHSSVRSSTKRSSKSSTTSATRKWTTSSTTTSTRKQTTSSTNKPPYFTCPTADGLFNDPDNCGKFYQCSNRRPYKMSCPASLHFSKITQRCEYPCDAKCDLTLNCGVPIESPKDPKCSCRNCKHVSPETCTKYIECTNGKYKLVNCPRGQTFDEKRSICDWAHRVNCRHSALCPRLNGLFPHEDCHKFVHCSNGIPYVRNCGYNLEFDPARQRCEWPAGRCNASPIAKEFEIFRPKEHREGWNCPKRFGYFVDEHNCDKFFFCSYETPQLKECSEGLMYNPRHQNCDWKKHVRCDSNRRLHNKRCRRYDRHVTCPADRASLPHDRCNMYYDCSEGAACTKQCPVGLYFNKATGMCDLPANVNCFYSSRNKEYSLRDFTASCTAKDLKKMSDPADKACFYHCRHGKVVAGCCGKGHVYDVHNDKCERT